MDRKLDKMLNRLNEGYINELAAPANLNKQLANNFVKSRINYYLRNGSDEPTAMYKALEDAQSDPTVYIARQQLANSINSIKRARDTQIANMAHQKFAPKMAKYAMKAGYYDNIPKAKAEDIEVAYKGEDDKPDMLEYKDIIKINDELKKLKKSND